jgi:tetratricopeptide (TPR) repeat protein
VSLPSLSAALIVKDGGSDFARCLESIRPHVDEIIVADTGSSDDSIEVAERVGAKVIRYDWSDDFASARNAALAHVQTDWFLSIDADEELVCVRSREELNELFQASARVMLDLQDAHSGSMVKLPRLFKMVADIHWQQPVHETLVQPGVDSQVMVDATQGIYLRHHGYRPETNPIKVERNLRILRSHLSRNPDDPGSLFFLARECAWVGEHQEGHDAGERLLATADLEGVLLADALAVTAWCAIYLRNFERAVELMRDARRSDVANAWTEYLLALALANSGNRNKAREAIDRSCSMPYPDQSMLVLTEVWTSKRFVLQRSLTV